MSERDGVPPGVILDSRSSLYQALLELARHARLVFFAGLPGTGKSLLINQLAHLADAAARKIALLQWDVARPVFQGSAAGRRYPEVRGVTHAVIRVAVGRWARQAVARWDGEHLEGEYLLIGETPFAGHRFIELARPVDDAAEPVLSGERTRFVVPVPSRDVRRHLEAERARRARHPVHAREAEDAAPEVLRDLWRQLVSAARALGDTPSSAHAEDPPPYDPRIYERVYTRILRHRRTQVLSLDVVLPTATFSPYALRVPSVELTPSDDEACRFIRAVEDAYPDPAALQREIERWYR